MYAFLNSHDRDMIARIKDSRKNYAIIKYNSGISNLMYFQDLAVIKRQKGYEIAHNGGIPTFHDITIFNYNGELLEVITPADIPPYSLPTAYKKQKKLRKKNSIAKDNPPWTPQNGKNLPPRTLAPMQKDSRSRTPYPPMPRAVTSAETPVYMPICA